VQSRVRLGQGQGNMQLSSCCRHAAVALGEHSERPRHAHEGQAVQAVGKGSHAAGHDSTRTPGQWRTRTHPASVNQSRSVASHSDDAWTRANVCVSTSAESRTGVCRASTNTGLAGPSCVAARSNPVGSLLRLLQAVKHVQDNDTTTKATSQLIARSWPLMCCADTQFTVSSNAAPYGARYGPPRPVTDQAPRPRVAATRMSCALLYAMSITGAIGRFVPTLVQVPRLAGADTYTPRSAETAR
jgi:hypothetical protein